MSAKAAFAELEFELVTADGVPMDKPIHRKQMNLFISLICSRMSELGRADYFAGGDMFVYYSVEQAEAVAEEERQLALFEAGELSEEPKKTAFRGPDVFLVQNVEGEHERQRDAWVAWQEGDRLPDLIVELLSPSTAAYDRGAKKRLYEETFKTSEYFLYAPRGLTPEGFRLLDNSYQSIARSTEGRLWSRELEIEVGVWHGEHDGVTDNWLRLFHPDGRLVPTATERERQRADTAEQRADTAEQRADTERQRADAAEAELARLRTRFDADKG
jgi:Uma2 family endonuclease